MRFYVITAISNFIDNPRIQCFHADMFHGLVERGGKEPPHDARVWANTEPPSSLLISRTARRVPEISKPSSHLVVSQRLAEQLRPFPRIRLAPVVFKRLVDVDYEPDDMTWDEKWGDVDPLQLLRTLPDVPDFHERIGHYFEVQTWRWRDVIDKYPSAKEFTIEERTPPMEEASVIRLSAELFQDHPLLCYGDLLVSEDAFRILDKALDRVFFLVREYRLG